MTLPRELIKNIYSFIPYEYIICCYNDPSIDFDGNDMYIICDSLKNSYGTYSIKEYIWMSIINKREFYIPIQLFDAMRYHFPHKFFMFSQRYEIQ